jgi:triacylglycerol lipase
MSLILIASLCLLVLCVAIALVVVRRRRRGVEPAVAPSEQPPEQPPVTALEVRRPVVLVHGIFGFDHIGVLGRRQHYFRGVVDHLARAGVPVYTVRLGALDSVPARALALAEFVRGLPHPRVTVIAHSMGGLDARYAISRLGLHDRVAELITIGTPHQGSPVADLAACRPALLVRKVAGRLGVRSEAVDWLTTQSLVRFNREVPDAPGVSYCCVVARASTAHLWRNPLLLACHLLVRRSAGENDGMVPETSQRWGRVLDVVAAHHWAQIGWSLRFRATSMYETILRRLHAPAGETLEPATFDRPVRGLLGPGDEPPPARNQSASPTSKPLTKAAQDRAA